MLDDGINAILSESPFSNDTTIYTTFTKGSDSKVLWSGARDGDGNPVLNGHGRVLIEVNDANTSNNWLKLCDLRK